LLNHLVDNLLRRGEILDQCSNTAHEPWAGGSADFGTLLEFIIVGNNTLGGEFLDLLLTVLLPVIDVGSPEDPQGTTSINDRAGSTLKVSLKDQFLVDLGGTGLLGGDETCANPDGLSTVHQVGSQTTTIIDGTGGDNIDWATSQWALVALDGIDTGGDEYGSGNITGVSSTLASLGADNVNTLSKGLGDMLGVANHIHDEDASIVKLVNDLLGRNTDSADEKLAGQPYS